MYSWEEDLLVSMRKQQKTVVKFKQELERIFLHSSGGLTQLRVRIKPASIFFIYKIEWKIIPLFGANYKKAMEKKYNKNDLASLDLVNTEFKKIKKNINNAFAAFEEIIDGCDYKIILTKLKELKVNNYEVKQESPIIKKSEEILSCSSNSFKLFRSEKPVTEIAKIRGLANHTIELHLTDFIKTGELSVFDIIKVNVLCY